MLPGDSHATHAAHHSCLGAHQLCARPAQWCWRGCAQSACCWAVRRDFDAGTTGSPYTPRVAGSGAVVTSGSPGVPCFACCRWRNAALVCSLHVIRQSTTPSTPLPHRLHLCACQVGLAVLTQVAPAWWWWTHQPTRDWRGRRWPWRRAPLCTCRCVPDAAGGRM
jgi:hypothetical protein